MDVTILNDRVLVRKKEVETKTSGGIVLTGSAATPTFEATVLKVGEGKRTKDGNLIPLAVKPRRRNYLSPKCRCTYDTRRRAIAGVTRR
jgi:co-chaperonin GroES (HSP10)